MATINAEFEEMNNTNKKVYQNFAADKGMDVCTVIFSFCTAFTLARADNIARDEAQAKKMTKKKRKKIKKKRHLHLHKQRDLER